jgi:hypothetical protein
LKTGSGVASLGELSAMEIAVLEELTVAQAPKLKQAAIKAIRKKIFSILTP